MKRAFLILTFVFAVASASGQTGQRYSWMDMGNGTAQPVPFSLLAVGAMNGPTGSALNITGDNSARVLNLTIPVKLSVYTNDAGFITSAQANTAYDASGAASTEQSRATAAENVLTTSVNGKYAQPTGTVTQYVRGDGTLAAFPTVPTNTNQLTNGAGFVTSAQAASAAPVQSVAGRTGVVVLSTTDISGLGSAASQPSNAFDAAGAASTEQTRALAAESVLTTSVNGKEPTITAGTTVQYWRGDKTWQVFPAIPAAQIQSDWNQTTTTALDFIKNKPSIPSGQVQSDWNAVAAPAAILNKPTIPATSTIIVNAPLTNAGTTTAANLSVSAATGSTAGTMSASDYSKLAAYPAYAARVFSAPTFAGVTTAAQLSLTRDAEVSYEFDGSISITVLGTQTINAVLTYADNSAMTTNPVVMDAQSFTGGGVAGLSQTQTLKLSGIVPAGKYRKVTFSTSSTGVGLGAPAAPTALKAGAEVLL